MWSIYRAPWASSATSCSAPRAVLDAVPQKDHAVAETVTPCPQFPGAGSARGAAFVRLAVTTSGDDVERRVARLERDVARLREEVALAGTDAGAARALASGADRDVSEVRAELRAHLQVLNALRQTQLEQGQALEHLQQETSDGFATVRIGMAQIVSLLESGQGTRERP